MTENDIRGTVLQLVGALKADEIAPSPENKAVVIDAGVKLVTNVLVDLNRIATALEFMSVGSK